MAGNKSLGKAKDTKQDEFYTQLSDIENELRHYKEHFRGKVVFCNCDDPYESNFFKYFAMNFNYLGLKKLITTCYVSSPVMYTQLSLFDDMQYSYPDPKSSNKKPYKVEISEVLDENGDGSFDMEDIRILLKNKKNACSILNGDGDFRSEECTELLREADIVVTNPPFSLFREYMAQLIEYDKSFVIIGARNAIHYKEIFPLIKGNKVWLGYGFRGGNAYFSVPKQEGTRFADGVYDAQTGLVKFRNCVWFTNLDTEKRHEEIVLFKHYSSENYPKYENYDAIDVSRISDIPVDYFENMGVPDTFLENYNPEQFEIIGLGCGDLGKDIGVTRNYRGRTDIAYKDKDGNDKCPYSRIIIRRKEQK